MLSLTRAVRSILHLSTTSPCRRKSMYVPSLPKVGAPPGPAPLREIALEDGAQSDLIWVVSGARCLLIVGLCLFVTGVVNAQTPDPSPVDAPRPGVRPALGPFPRFEDWSFLRDPSKWIDPFDRLKFIPLKDSGTNYLTLGVENR